MCGENYAGSLLPAELLVFDYLQKVSAQLPAAGGIESSSAVTSPKPEFPTSSLSPIPMMMTVQVQTHSAAGFV